MVDERSFLENAVHEIRPKVLFEKVEAAFAERDVMFNVMVPTSVIGGLTLLESSILVTLTILLSPEVFFEFGTYHGATSVLLAANSSEHARITTVDLPRDNAVTASADDPGDARHLRDAVANDNYLRRNSAATGAIHLDRAEQRFRSKVTRIHCDSRTLDPIARGLDGRFDFIFIDGGHDLETVASDTANALRMAKDDSVIIWHDYRSDVHREVTRFVDGFSGENPVIHVQHTMIAFTLRGRFRRLM